MSDSKLKFDANVASVCRKVGGQVNALNRLQNILPCKVKEFLYRAFVLLAGDSAYPLMNWLLKPFADRGRLTPEQRKFNLKFSALRCVVERIFGMLKSRWRIMLKKIEQKNENVEKDCNWSLRSTQHLH